MFNEVFLGAVCLDASLPLSASSGEQTCLLDDEESSADGGGVGDRLVAVNGKLLA